jgi:hypothetical protein
MCLNGALCQEGISAWSPYSVIMALYGETSERAFIALNETCSMV